MRTLSIDIETYSDVPLQKSGVYRYCESPNFEILLFGYSADAGPVQVVDLTAGEAIPADVLDALTDDAVTKWAFNAGKLALLDGLGGHDGTAAFTGRRRRGAGA